MRKQKSAAGSADNVDSPNCLNCGEALRGQYCGNCGQRAASRLISIWELLRDAFGDLFEFDSRLWRTLIPLMLKPGQLTLDYLEGRRARYMPPFRTYLVLSVIFFVVASFNPRDDFSIFFEPEPPPTPEEQAAQEAAAEQQKLEQQRELDSVRAELQELADEEDGFNISMGGESSGFFDDCENATITGDEDAPEWIRKRFTDERVQEICRRNQARGVENFADAILDNIPVALIVLLPLMALVLKFLYPLSRRFFVEHLLFFVHFHAFFFLLLTCQILFERLAQKLSMTTLSGIVLVATSFYVPVYLYKAMRRVYAQGHVVTSFKYILLLIAYSVGAAFTMMSVLLLTVLSA